MSCEVGRENFNWAPETSSQIPLEVMTVDIVEAPLQNNPCLEKLSESAIGMDTKIVAMASSHTNKIVIASKCHKERTKIFRIEIKTDKKILYRKLLYSTTHKVDEELTNK
jgi:hypothetical protein